MIESMIAGQRTRGGEGNGRGERNEHAGFQSFHVPLPRPPFSVRLTSPTIIHVRTCAESRARNSTRIFFLLLESVNLQSLFLTKSVLQQKRLHVGSLVTLELDDLAVLRMFDDSSVAGKLFFQRLHDSLLVKLLRDSLHGGKGLAAVPLLDSDVNERVAVHAPSNIVFVHIERIEVGKVLKLGHSKWWCGPSIERKRTERKNVVETQKFK